jgi:hypothetical protein
MVPPSIAGGPDPFAVAEASDVADVLEVPTADRGRFESVYLSLARSSAGQSLSPSVRAARALAIVAGMDAGAGGATSAQERARAAWTVMPVVFGGDARELPPDHPLAGRLANDAPVRRTPDLSLVRGADDLEQFAAPMSGLAARAGEAIGSYVQPTVREVGGASSGAVRGEGRTERSFPEPGVRDLVRTGRPFSRVGGGETEIPAWFESAARRMLEQRGLSETISVAELALVASAPSRQIAAATRGNDPSPAMTQAPPGEAGAAQGEKPDIDKLAGDVYTAVLDLIAVARQRSGDPWV